MTKNQQNRTRHVNEGAPLVRGSSSRKMTYGLLSCCGDMGVCCDVFWCSPCLLGYTCDAIVHNQPNSMNVGVCMGVSLAYLAGTAGAVYVNLVLGPIGSVAYAIGCLPYTLVTCQQRGEVRQKLGQKDNMCCNDFVLSWCCLACVQCQLTREAKALGLHPGSCCCGDDETPDVLHTVPQVAVQPGYANTAR